MIYHNFALQPGYVEDTVLCEMSVSHDEGFENIESAMEDLRLTIVAWLLFDNRTRSCCKKSLENEENHFCPNCGTRLEQYRTPNAETVQDAFMKMPMTTVDEGADMLQFFEERGWNLCGFYHFPEEKACSVRAVARWMGRDSTDDFPYMEGTYPDGTEYCSFREHR